MKRSDALAALRACLNRSEAGARLPAERVLAGRIGCSRETLRSALGVLAEEGLVWRHVGQGTFQGPKPRDSPVRDKLLIEVSSPADLLEARIVIDPSVAAAAAQIASPGDTSRLMRHVEEGRIARDLAGCEQADSGFHRAVSELAANPVLQGVLAYLSDVRRRRAWQHEWGRTYRRVGVAEFTGLHSDQHARIATAIAEGAPDTAEAEMRAHLRTVRETMLRTD
jgi:DNA-binding FadR family transcriptional regulator